MPAGPEGARGPIDEGWKSAEPAGKGTPPGAPAYDPAVRAPNGGDDGPRTVLRAEAELFRNTYYDFPRDLGGKPRATIYDAACAPIADVSQAFHDRVCVQGSGKLASGDTVSFAKRGCACAAVCPRTGQKICFEKLDPARFPHGRGAANRPITPLYTVAVDPSVIPLGTRIFVPELAGLPRPGGGTHDGCFVAEDKGLKVVGRHIDVFTGDPKVTAAWNRMLPSNTGVHVRIADPHCRAR